MSRIAYIVFFALLVVPCISDAETIDVQIKGVDDGAKTTKQRDYKEAVLFAKREAIERAGVKIKSMKSVGIVRNYIRTGLAIAENTSK